MLKKFERYPLTFGPTPIEKLDRLGKHLGGKVEASFLSSNTSSLLRSRRKPIRLSPSEACNPTTRGWSRRSPPRSA